MRRTAQALPFRAGKGFFGFGGEDNAPVRPTDRPRREDRDPYRLVLTQMLGVDASAGPTDRPDRKDNALYRPTGRLEREDNDLYGPLVAQMLGVNAPAVPTDRPRREDNGPYELLLAQMLKGNASAGQRDSLGAGALAGLTTPLPVGPAPTSFEPGRGGGGNAIDRSTSISVGEITVNVPGADSKEIARNVRSALEGQLVHAVDSADTLLAR